jgi:hypothetical protein
VTFIEIPVQNETLALEIKINELRDKLKKLEETLQEKELQIAGLSLMAEQLQQVFQSRSWRITKPLRDMIAKFKS